MHIHVGYVCINIYVWDEAYVNIRVLSACIYILCIHTYICTFVHTYIHIYVYMYIHIYIYIYLYAPDADYC